MIAVWGQESSMVNPLKLDTIEKGDIEGLRVFTRFDCRFRIGLLRRSFLDSLRTTVGVPRFPSATDTGVLVDVHRLARDPVRRNSPLIVIWFFERE